MVPSQFIHNDDNYVDDATDDYVDNVEMDDNVDTNDINLLMIMMLCLRTPDHVGVTNCSLCVVKLNSLYLFPLLVFIALLTNKIYYNIL